METEKHLLDLPTEVLMKIFSYVPNKVPLKFSGLDVYKIICKIEQNKYRLVIRDDNLHDHKIILRSIRVFDEILITRIWDFNEYAMARILEMLKKHQKTVRKVTISFAALAEHNLIKILNSLPGIQEVVIDVSLWFVSCVPQQQLNKLTKVISFTTNIESSVMILELPENVLKKLSFCSATHNVAPPTELLRSIFKKQKCIDDLTLNPKNIESDSLALLELKNLTVINNEHLAEIVKQQSHLESLVVRSELENMDLLALYEYCRQLVLLEINVEKVSPELLRQLNCLQMLKDLTLTVKDYQIFDLTFVALPNLKKFHLFNHQSCEKFGTFANAVPKIFPNLRHLTVASALCSDVSTLLKNKHLGTLNILEIKSNQTELIYFKNESVKELSIGFVSSSAHRDILKIFTNSLPNLWKLRISKFVFTDIENLLDVLKAFKQLTHIAVTGSNFSLVISNPMFSTFLKIHKNSLESFEFTSNEREFSRGLKQKSELESKLQKMKNMFNHQFSFIFIDGSKFVMQCNFDKW